MTAAGGSVLILDLDPDSAGEDCATAAKVVRGLGFSVELTCDSAEAAQRVRLAGTDLVIVALAVPSQSILDLVSQFREVDPRLAIILISGRPSLEFVTWALHNGVSAFLTRPLKTEELLSHVHAALEKQKLQRQNENLLETARRQIIERQVSEQALEESERRFYQFMDFFPGLSYIKDDRGRYLFINRYAEQELGWPVRECLGHRNGNMWPQALAEAIARDEAEVIAAAKLLLRVYDLPSSRGAVPHETYLFRISPGSGNFRLGALCLDITERQWAEKTIENYQLRLRALVSQISLNEQRQQRTIAQQLHDDFGRSLTLSKMKVTEALTNELPGETRADLDAAIEHLDHAIKFTRSLTAQLASPVLYELGLESALERLVEDTAEQHELEISIDNDGEPKPLNTDVQMVVYQCVRELLLNIIKHAEAELVSVSIRRSGKHMQLIVSDDGLGFNHDPKKLARVGETGFGLFSIQERLEHLGGGISINSIPGEGTVIRLTVPLET